MYIQPYLRTQADLLADIQADGYTTALGWSAPEVYRAVNRALSVWQKRVLIARAYTISGGWLASTYEYSLPAYVRPPVTAQMERNIPFNDDIDLSSTETWQDIAVQTEPNSSGGLQLRLLGLPHTVDGRLIWYAPNSRVPTGTTPTTNASLTAADTSLTMGSVVDVDDVGWVKVEAEWMAYSGITRGTSTTTLTNLVRGQYDTTAASHNSSSSVVWGIAADDLILYEQLADQTKAYLHQQMLINTSVHETGRHERLMQYYQAKADSVWSRYRSQRPRPQVTLNRQFLLRS